MAKCDCNKCKHAEISTGAYTNTCYIECGLERKAVESMTMDQLNDAIDHPEKYNFCKYAKGTPVNVGVTFDD